MDTFWIINCKTLDDIEEKVCNTFLNRLTNQLKNEIGHGYNRIYQICIQDFPFANFSAKFCYAEMEIFPLKMKRMQN